MASAQLPDGETAPIFEEGDSVSIASSRAFSIPTTGELTLEAWIAPSTLTFARTEGTGYVDWMGKGGPGGYEYALRMYSAGNSEGRGNRTSGYAFNPRGGKGSGSYFQDVLQPGKWLFVTVVFTLQGSAHYAPNSVSILRDGVVRKSTSLSQFHVAPQEGTYAFSIGSLTGASYFQGAIAKPAIFDRALAPSEVLDQFRAMTG